MQRMMAKAPGDRPGSMDQIIQELVSLRLKNNLGITDNLCHLLSTELREVDLKPRKKARGWSPSHKPRSLLTAAAIGTLVGSLLVGVGFFLLRNSEKSFLTPSTSAARFEVHLVQADEGVTIKGLSDAIKLLEGELSIKSKTSARFRFIDFIDPMSNSGGFFDADLAFPGFNVLNNTEQSNHFALRARATFSIPRSGFWTFGVISDDGFRLSIDGKVVGEHNSSRTQAGSFIPVELTKTGPHVLELIYFEGTGGADLEICVAEGRYDDFDGEAFQLLGASYDGGLPLLRPE